jgi:hypothetical protein
VTRRPGDRYRNVEPRADPSYPWVQALDAARRRLSRLKRGTIIAAVLGLGAISGGISASRSSEQPAPPATDIFGQQVDAGQPNMGQLDFGHAPAIVSAPS